MLIKACSLSLMAVAVAPLVNVAVAAESIEPVQTTARALDQGVLRLAQNDQSQGGTQSGAAQSAAEGSASAAGTLQEIVVTGSRIPQQRGVESVSPIVSVGAAALEERGAMRYEDLLNRLPQVVGAPEGSSSTGRGLTGTTQLDLRGLGPGRTLVLINGRRMPYGSPSSVAADINQIPMALLKNVEVLTGGASAVYGSDALAGVVNFVLRDDFDGVKVSTTIGGYQHQNDNGLARRSVAPWELNNPGDYPMPDENVWDGFSSMFSVAAGTNFDEGKGNVTAYASYRQSNEVKMFRRDYTICSLVGVASDNSILTCNPSPVDIDAGFVNTGATGLPQTFRVDGDQFVPRNALIDQYNELPYSQLQRNQEQYDFGAFAHYEISKHLVPFLETSFYRVKTKGEQSPEGVLNNGILGEGAGGFNCDNPFFSAQEANFLCGSRGLSTGSSYDPVTGAYISPDDIATGVLLRRRTAENGLRDKLVDMQTFRAVLGLRGEINQAFNYELSTTYASVRLNQKAMLINQAKAAQALFAVVDQRVNPDGSPLDPATYGQPACYVNVNDSPFDNNPACVPLDYFSLAGPSAAALDFIDEFGYSTGTTTMSDVLATVSGNLGAYGITSPLASNGVGIAVGAEYRKNSLDSNYDAISVARGLGQSISGSTSVSEVFGEINIPLVEDRPFFNHLSLEGAYRNSDYKDSVTTDTYKLGLTWEPVSDVRFRTSFQRAIRAPNVIELYSPQFAFNNLALVRNPDGSFDPCAGTTPFATLEQCQRMGVTPAQYGTIADQPFARQLTGGNPNLEPETGETFSTGVVFKPSFIPGLVATLDRWDIDIEGLVGVVNANASLRSCLQTGNPFFCSLIHRGAGGTLFATEDSYISQLNINTGSLSTTGWDLMVNYPLDLGSVFGGRDLGAMSLTLNGTYLEKYEIKPLPTSTAAEIADCAGYHGFTCGMPKPTWRHIANVQWATPWSDIQLGLTWRYISSVDPSRKSSQPALTGPYFPRDKLSSRSYLDLSMGWTPPGQWSVRAGINNLFDKDPPLTGITGSIGSIYPTIYDSLGRYMFLTVSLQY